MARIICVGIATLDVINKVQRYPAEDAEVRALAQSQRMGGNAANTSLILAQLGDQTSWVGNLAQPAEVADRAFARHGVNASNAVRIPGGVMPTSYILLSEATGSRSIVHFRDLPEYRSEDFLKLDLSDFDWVHFEGRAIDQLAVMMAYACGIDGLSVSLEAEKPRDGMDGLFKEADLLMFSRDYAEAQGFQEATALLNSLPRGTVASCTWGDQGAWVIDGDGQVFHAPATVLDAVVDTLGAGDVFNAGMIHAMSGGRSVTEALSEAVALASAKCDKEGLMLSL